MDKNNAPIKVLIADDDEILCGILKDVLTGEDDIEVAGVAHNGLDACEKIAALKPDVAILDCAMPALDGIGVLEKLRASAYFPTCIVLSGNGNEAVTRHALDLGAAYYLIKPFDPKTLAKRIRIFCGNKGGGENAGCINGGGLEKQAAGILNRIGFPVQNQGYYYMLAAIVKCAEDVIYVNAMEKKLYPYIAETRDTTVACVERSIRSAISDAWKHGGLAALGDILGRNLRFRKNKPSNSELIALIADTLRVSSFSQK